MRAYIKVTFKGPFNRNELDFGALTITHSSGRSYILDVTQSWLGEDGSNSIELRATEDFETFPKDEENPYDLTLADIGTGGITATLFIGGEDTTEVDCIYYDIEDEHGNTIAEGLAALEECGRSTSPAFRVFGYYEDQEPPENLDECEAVLMWAYDSAPEPDSGYTEDDIYYYGVNEDCLNKSILNKTPFDGFIATKWEYAKVDHTYSEEDYAK